MNSTSRHPKTHSEILWHFTGGLLWDSKNNQQLTKPKSITKAFTAFTSILRTRELRIGEYHEIINCIERQEEHYNEKNETMCRNEAVNIVQTAKICCVADIPIAELFHHAKRYGKIAVGFKRDSLN